MSFHDKLVKRYSRTSFRFWEADNFGGVPCLTLILRGLFGFSTLIGLHRPATVGGSALEGFVVVL